MSNIAYITTRRQIKSYDMMKLLNKINEKRFNGKMTIVPKDGGWDVSYGVDGTYGWGFWIHPDSPKKLACKHPHGQWMQYVFVVFRQELAALTRGLLSDEGLDETWKPTPKKYSTYRRWIELLYPSLKKTKPASYFEELIENELQQAPKELRNF